MRISTLAAVTISAAFLCSFPGTASAAPAGTTIGVEPLPAAAAVPAAAKGERLVYNSTTVGDQPIRATAGVFLPPGNPPPGGWPIMAWAHGTVGVGDSCAPSVAGPAYPDRDNGYLGHWLQQGYAVVAADYAGLNGPGDHPYLNGRVAAHNVVDSVLAARQQYPSLSNKWAVIGQSQGGNAAVMTARYATEWGGPSLDYRGGVATGVPAYTDSTFGILAPHIPPIKLPESNTAYALYTLIGLEATHPEVNLQSYLTDAGRYWLGRAKNECLKPFGKAASDANVVIGDLIARPLSDIPNVRGLVAAYSGLPETGYDKPLFQGQGLTDTDISTPSALQFGAALVANRQPVTPRVYTTDHGDTMTASLPDTTPFVANIFK